MSFKWKSALCATWKKRKSFRFQWLTCRTTVDKPSTRKRHFQRTSGSSGSRRGRTLALQTKQHHLLWDGTTVRRAALACSLSTLRWQHETDHNEEVPRFYTCIFSTHSEIKRDQNQPHATGNNLESRLLLCSEGRHKILHSLTPLWVFFVSSHHWEHLWNTNVAMTPPEGSRRLTNQASHHKSSQFGGEGSRGDGVCAPGCVWVCSKTGDMIWYFSGKGGKKGFNLTQQHWRDLWPFCDEAKDHS